SSITTYHEAETLASWQNGDAVFARNWPYQFALSNDPKASKVAGKLEVHTMLFGGSNTSGHSSLGGWQYGINAFSKNPDAGWKFIQHQLAEPAQKTIALKLSLTATLKSIYTDADVLKANPFFTKLKPVFDTAQPRPVTPFYSDVSNAIQVRIHNALTGQSSPQAALTALTSDLQAIVSR